MLVLEAFLVVYLVGSIIMQAVGPGPRGDWLEYYGYLVTAMLIPAGAFFYSSQRAYAMGDSATGGSRARAHRDGSPE